METKHSVVYGVKDKGGDVFAQIEQDAPPAYTPVSSSASPSSTGKIVIAVVTVGILITGAIVSVAVILATRNGDGDGDDGPYKWNAWTPWSNCDSTCTQTRTRTCENDGNKCEGLATQQQMCQDFGCQVESGNWTIWGEWTTCTVTCANGIHNRYRTCGSETSAECIGDYVETSVCTLTSCPVYGTWTTWSPWATCDVTCDGGMQQRSRQCLKNNPSDIDCVGKSSQEQPCSSWQCPDCNTVCTSGTLNSACDTCECQSTFKGRVLAEKSGFPIPLASVYASTAPTQLLATTNSTGFFLLTSLCADSEILVSREGFLDQNAVLSGLLVEINMTQISLPRITVAPSSKYRLVDDSVMFCCLATADPPVTYYEWFKDSVIIDESLYQDSGHQLVLNALATTSSGQYKCRANSPAGAIVSASATLTVKATPNDFCTDALQQKTITLPSDCVQPTTKTATYQVGDCIAKRCRSNATNSDDQCTEELTSCCAVEEAAFEIVQCSGYELDVIVVKSCGCAECEIGKPDIAGTVLSFSDESPISFADVYLNGNYETFTNSYGTFSIPLSSPAQELTIYVEDNYDMKHLPSTKIVKLPEDISGKIQVVIKMMPYSEPIQISSNVSTTLLPRNAEDVAVVIPADAFYTSDGQKYDGTVSTRMTFLDTANTSLLEDLPGDFSFTDEEGVNSDLDSLGVFNLNFEDDSGNPLAMNQAITVNIPETGNDTSEEFDLWSLNPETGIWNQISETSNTSRKKRSHNPEHYYVKEIDMTTVTSDRWLNIDQPSKETSLCYFKCRIYKTSDFNEEDVNKNLVVQTNMIQNGVLKRYRNYWSNPTVCMYTLCPDLHGYIYVYPSNSHKDFLFVGFPKDTDTGNFEITDENKVLKILQEKTVAGPFFKSETECTTSQSGKYLRFYFENANADEEYIVNRIFNPPKRPPRNTDARDIRQKRSEITWYPNHPDEGYSVCFVKVKLMLDSSIASTSQIAMKVTSEAGTSKNIKGKLYGFLKQHLKSEDNTTICVEYKCSGQIGIGYDPHNDYTNVTVEVKSKSATISCVITQESPELVAADPHGNNNSQLGASSKAYKFLAPVDTYKDMGLYRASSDNDDIPTAKKTAKSDCFSGGKSSDTIKPDDGVAVTFSCT